MIRRLLLVLLLLVAGAGLGHAAEAAIKVYFNGQATTAKTVEVTGGGRIVPVYFPIAEGETTYEVKLAYDSQLHELKIERKPLKPKIRGDEDCYYCSGSGKCQNCFPLGSGASASGATCGLCNGNAKCAYCGGSGKK